MKNMAESFGLGWAPVGVKVRRLFKGGIEMKVLETVPEFRAGANDAPIHNVPSYNALSNAGPRYSQIGSLNHSIASFSRLMPSAGSARAVSKGTPPPSIG
jgi:hypothetical protein